MEEYKETLWEWITSWITAIYWRITRYFQSKMKRKLVITTLDKQYYDRDEILLHAAFQILVNFWEKEKPTRYGCFMEQDYILESLYLWWTEIRPKRDRDYFGCKYEKTDEEKLLLLVQNFRHMWT